MRKRTFTVLGGDLRQVRLAQCLQQAGHETRVWGVDPRHLPQGTPYCPDLSEALRDTQCVILPLPALAADGRISAPASDDSVTPEALFDRVPRRALCLAGRVTPALSAPAAARGIALADYFDREELAVLNAVPTAEGAIQTAMEALPITLHDARCLVLGHGRIGRVLAGMLRGLGARVTVSARSCADLAWIRAEGHTPALTGALEPLLPETDVVFNTVPAPVLDQRLLQLLPRQALCIDLASAPGGIDADAAQRLGLRRIHALSLPGKVAPVTSGEIVYSTVMNLLQERGFFSHET